MLNTSAKHNYNSCETRPTAVRIMWRQHKQAKQEEIAENKREQKESATVNIDIKKLALYVIAFIGFWNLLDYVFDVLIMHGGFIFKPTNILLPLVLSVVFFFLDASRAQK